MISLRICSALVLFSIALTAAACLADDTAYRFRIPDYGITAMSIQAPSVYVNQSFFVNATITVNDSYSAGVFNATLVPGSTFTLVNDDHNHSNPVLAGDHSQWPTGWDVNATVTEGAYQIQVDVPLFFSSENINITVVERPLNWSNGTIELTTGGPYNVSEAGVVYATLQDSLGNYVNIIGSCYASFYYPNSSLWKGEQFNYIEGTNGSYYASFVAPQANGDFLVSTACSVPQVSNSTTFNVVYSAPPPPPPPDDDPDGDTGGSTVGAAGGGVPEEPSSDIEIESYDSYVEIEQGDSDSIIVGVTNTGNNTLEGVTVSIEGLDIAWYVVNPLVADILANITHNFSITLNIPYDSLTGFYPYFIKVGTPTEEKTVESTMAVLLKRKISIVGISSTVLISEEPGTITVEVENTGETLETVGITIEVPPGWWSDENTITREVLPGRTEAFEFEVVPAQGTYNITITGTFSHGALSDAFAVTVGPPVVSFQISNEILIIIIAVALAAVILITVVWMLLKRMKIKRHDYSVIKKQVHGDNDKSKTRKRMEETLDRVEETFEKAEKALDKGDTGKALKEYKKVMGYKKVLEKYGEEGSLEEMSERMEGLHSRILARPEKKSVGTGFEKSMKLIEEFDKKNMPKKDYKETMKIIEEFDKKRDRLKEMKRAKKKADSEK